MKSYRIYLVFVVALALFGWFGCNSSDTPADDDVDDDDTGSTVTLSGSLATGSANLSGKAATVASGYTVVVHDNAGNKAYTATTESDGSFSVDIPTDGSYLVSIVNDGSYAGSVVFGGTDTEINTAISPTANEDLGDITLDTTNNYATTATTSDAIDSTVTATATAGVPFGAATDGVAVNSAAARDDSDSDQDGIPNLFDADEDNNGIRNGILTQPSTSEVVSDHIETVYIASNLWAVHGEVYDGSTDPATIAANEMALRLYVIPKEGQFDTISSVECVDLPTSIADVATIRNADSLNAPDAAEYENQLWSVIDHGLFTTTDDKYVVSIKPVAPLVLGDTFQLRVTYTDETTEDFFVSISYVLTDWAQVSTYDGTTLTENEGGRSGGAPEPATFDGDSLELVFTKPVDENGDMLNGMDYSVNYGIAEESGEGRWNVPATLPGTVTTTDAESTFTYTLDTTGAASGTTYYILPVVESSDQRNGEETWFTKD